MGVGLLLLAFLGFAVGSPPAGFEVRGRLVDQSGLPLPGVTVRLAPAGARSPLVAITDGDGAYRIPDVPAGACRLTAELPGFETATRDLTVASDQILPDITLGLSRFAEETTVVAILQTEVQPRSFAAPATLAGKVIENSGMKNNRYQDVLPLVPNVVRGADGTISMGGARALQGVVLFDGVPHTDPAAFDADAPLPLASIETLEVFLAGYPVDLGPASGGVTRIQPHSGADTFGFRANAFVPRPRWGRGVTQGIESWGPVLAMSGPIRKGSLWVAEALDYRFERAPARTAAGAEDRRQNGALSLTRFDARLSPRQALGGWVSADVERVDGYGINAFFPAASMPVQRRNAWSAAVVDRLTLGVATTLETRVSLRRNRVRMQPSGAGAGPYEIGHDRAQGRYFNAQDRSAETVYAAFAFSTARSTRSGDHVLKFGAALTRTSFFGSNSSDPVAYLRDSGSPVRAIRFVGDARFAANGHELGVFAAESWQLRRQWRVDAGVRIDSASFLPPVVAPRAGVTWLVTDRTTVTGGIGLLPDRMPLAARAFGSLPSRAETVCDVEGAPVTPTVVARNVSTGLERPRAAAWSAELNHSIARSWRLRLVYQQRRSSREPALAPAAGQAGEAIVLLRPTGMSRAWSVETTIGYKPMSAAHELYVSYVRSAARGNLNDYGSIEGSLRAPFLRPDAVSWLATDVPHRLIVWGLASLPGSMTFGPFLEIRSGFPYSGLHDDWSYAGHPNTHRFPAFASLDLVLTKDFKTFGDIPLRIGVKVFNATNARNGRDVQRSVDRRDFGRTYNAIGTQVRGFLEVLWGEKRK